eukprot:Pgem_evm1s8237
MVATTIRSPTMKDDKKIIQSKDNISNNAFEFTLEDNIDVDDDDEEVVEQPTGTYLDAFGHITCATI